MPALPRSATVDPFEVGVYHAYNSVVRGRRLLGYDPLLKKDFGHRKVLLRNRMQHLCAGMAIEVLDYAILSNHFHTVLRNRSDIVQRWDDEEVARRWWQVCPKRRKRDGTPADPKSTEIRSYLAKAEEYRARLADVSWFMRLATQPIARLANKEDEVKGRFFAERFKCNKLESPADVLNCSIYVDLNIVRAGLADAPETSEFTSAYDRIQARWIRLLREDPLFDGGQDGPLPDNWLAPIFLDERADAYIGPLCVPGVSIDGHSEDVSHTSRQLELVAGEEASVAHKIESNRSATPDAQTAFIQKHDFTPASSDSLSDRVIAEFTSDNADSGSKGTRKNIQTAFYNELGASRVSDKGFLPIGLEQYLSLLDTVGRVVRSDKPGAIPSNLEPILQRIGLEPQSWLEGFHDWFHAPTQSFIHSHPPPQLAAG
ncbi:MAG: hypothetical protein KDA61_05300 [Planctomycetales bacterium]|nr:hypothetical protein [Planctomycetales bacterium]